jgi:hypothetical protein
MLLYYCTINNHGTRVYSTAVNENWTRNRNLWWMMCLESGTWEPGWERSVGGVSVFVQAFWDGNRRRKETEEQPGTSEKKVRGDLSWFAGPVCLTSGFLSDIIRCLLRFLLIIRYPSRHERGIDACSCFTRYLFPDQVIDHQTASWRGQRIAERKVQRKEVRFVSLGASVKKH